VRRIRAATTFAEVAERQPRKRPEVAVALEAGKTLIFPLIVRALTRESATEVRMSQANRPAHKSSPAAERADVIGVGLGINGGR
jgi:hypothetical protein